MGHDPQKVHNCFFIFSIYSLPFMYLDKKFTYFSKLAGCFSDSSNTYFDKKFTYFGKLAGCFSDSTSTNLNKKLNCLSKLLSLYKLKWHTHVITLTVHINVDWLHFFMEIREKVNSGNWVREKCTRMGWISCINFPLIISKLEKNWKTCILWKVFFLFLKLFKKQQSVAIRNRGFF